MKTMKSKITHKVCNKTGYVTIWIDEKDFTEGQEVYDFIDSYDGIYCPACGELLNDRDVTEHCN